MKRLLYGFTGLVVLGAAGFWVLSAPTSVDVAAYDGLPGDAKALAFMAAYRDLDRARWREVRPLEPGKPLGLNVVFGARQIRLEPALPPPAPAK